MKLDDFSVKVADFVKKLFLVNKCSADSDVLLNKNNNKKNKKNLKRKKRKKKLKKKYQ